MRSNTAALLDVVHDGQPRYFVTVDGTIVYGTLVPATPRSRSQFKVMTGTAGRPRVLTAGDIVTWCHRKSEATYEARAQRKAQPKHLVGLSERQVENGLHKYGTEFLSHNFKA